MLDQKPIKDLQNRDIVNHFFLLKRFELKKKKDGSDYLVLEVGDKTGSLIGNYWEGFENFYNQAFNGAIIKVKGNVELFNDRIQLRIDSASLVEDNEEVSISDFLPTTSRNIDEMKKEFWNRVKKIQNNWLVELIKLVFTKERFEKFAYAPAGKSVHHNYIAGLIEHTLEIVNICDLMCDMYEKGNYQPPINRDLLIAGALLHDIGKIEELTYEAHFDYTDKGKLIGHIVIAANWIYNACRQIPYFPEELETLLIHLILSHQGKLENASPVEPKTLESIVLYHADELSAKTNAYRQIINTGGELNSNWTKYHSLIQSSLFISKDPEYYQKRSINEENNLNNNDEQSKLPLFDGKD